MGDFRNELDNFDINSDGRTGLLGATSLAELVSVAEVIRDPKKHAVRTLEEVAQELGVTRERVRQIEASALAKLRKRLQAMGITAEMVATTTRGWPMLPPERTSDEEARGRDSEDHESAPDSGVFLMQAPPKGPQRSGPRRTRR